MDTEEKQRRSILWPVLSLQMAACCCVGGTHHGKHMEKSPLMQLHRMEPPSSAALIHSLVPLLRPRILEVNLVGVQTLLSILKTSLPSKGPLEPRGL